MVLKSQNQDAKVTLRTSFSPPRNPSSTRIYSSTTSLSIIELYPYLRCIKCCYATIFFHVYLTPSSTSSFPLQPITRVKLCIIVLTPPTISIHPSSPSILDNLTSISIPVFHPLISPFQPPQTLSRNTHPPPAPHIKHSPFPHYSQASNTPCTLTYSPSELLFI